MRNLCQQHEVVVQMPEKIHAPFAGMVLAFETERWMKQETLGGKV